MVGKRLLGRWVRVGTILLAAALLLAPGPGHQVESLGTQLFAPVQLGISGALGGVGDFLARLRRVADLSDQNASYRVEIDRLQSELVRLRELELENEVLRRLLSLQQQTRPGELLPVRVVANDVSPFVRTITVDRGANDGVRNDMAVVTWKGLVGKVIRTNATTAKVLLLTDTNSSVSVRIQDPESRATGLARGRPDGSLLLEHVPQQERLAAGQIAITSGLGGVFPEGLVVGRVAQVIRNDYEVFQRARIQLAVDMTKLEHPYIILDDPNRRGE